MRIYKVGQQWYADIRGIEGLERTRRPVGPWATLTEDQARVRAYQLAAQLKDEAGQARARAGWLHAATATWLRLRRRGRSDESICRAIATDFPDCPLDEVTDRRVAEAFGHLGDANFDRHVSTLNSILPEAAPAAPALTGNLLRVLTSLGPLEFVVPPEAFEAQDGSIKYVGGDITWTATEACTITGLEVEIGGTGPIPIDIGGPTFLTRADTARISFSPPGAPVYESITAGGDDELDLDDLVELGDDGFWSDC